MIDKGYVLTLTISFIFSGTFRQEYGGTTDKSAAAHVKAMEE